MHNKKYDVTGLGSVAVDFIGAIDKWPSPGTKNGMHQFGIYDGGLTGTALTAVSRLGGRAAYIGKRGSSELAMRSVDSLKNEGVDVSMVLDDPDSEPIIALVFSSSQEKERNIFFRKKNLKFPYPAEIPVRDWFRKTRVFFTDHVAGKAGVDAAKLALNAGVEVIVDVERIEEFTSDLLETASHIVVGERFAREYSGSEAADSQVRSLRKKDFQKIVITRGERGCSVAVNGYMKHFDAFPVNVLDTTGCGDVFHGAYALSVARGFSSEYSAIIASAAAAMKAGEAGGRKGIPTSPELNVFLEKNNYPSLIL